MKRHARRKRANTGGNHQRGEEVDVESTEDPSSLDQFLSDISNATLRVEAAIAKCDKDSSESCFADAPTPIAKTGDVFLDLYGMTFSNNVVQEKLESSQTWLTHFAIEANKTYNAFERHNLSAPSTKARADSDDDAEAKAVVDGQEPLLQGPQQQQQRYQQQHQDEKQEAHAEKKEDGNEEEEEEKDDDDDETRMARHALPSTFANYRTSSDGTFSMLLRKCEAAKQQCISAWAAKLKLEADSFKLQCAQCEVRSAALDQEVASLEAELRKTDEEINKGGLGAARRQQIVETRLRPAVLNLTDHDASQEGHLASLRASLPHAEAEFVRLRQVYAGIKSLSETDLPAFKAARRAGVVALAELEERLKKSRGELGALIDGNDDKWSALAERIDHDKERLDQQKNEECSLKASLEAFFSDIEASKEAQALALRELKARHAIVAEKLSALEDASREQRREARRKVYMELQRADIRERREASRPHFARNKSRSGDDDSEGVSDPYLPSVYSSTTLSVSNLAVDSFDSGDESFDNNPVLPPRPAAMTAKTVLAVPPGDVVFVDEATERALGFNESGRIQATLLNNARMIAKSAKTARNLELKVADVKHIDVAAMLDACEEQGEEEHVLVVSRETVPKACEAALMAGCYGLYNASYSISVLNTARKIRLETVSFDSTSFVDVVSSPPKKQGRSKTLEAALSINERLDGPLKYLIDLSHFEEDTDEVRTFRSFGLGDLECFNIAEGMQVMRRCVRSLLDSHLLDAALGAKCLAELDFIHRFQRTVVEGPTAAARRVEQAVRKMCMGVVESVVEKSPRALFVRNDRRLLSAALLPAFALLSVVVNCPQPTEAPTPAPAPTLAATLSLAHNPASDPAAAIPIHNRLVISKTALLLVTLVACGTQYPAPPRTKGRKARRHHQPRPVLPATEFVRTIRRTCHGLLASSAHRHAASLEALDAAVGKFISAAEEADALAEADPEPPAGPSGPGHPQAVVFSASHRHALLGCTLFLMHAAGHAEPPKELVLLETFHQGVRQLEDRLLSDHGVSSDLASRPVVPTWDLQALLALTSVDMVPAVVALDLFRRVLDEELQRQRFVRTIARGQHPELRFLNVTLSPRLEASLKSHQDQFIAGGLGFDPADAGTLSPRLAHRVWIEGLSRVVNEQCTRVIDLAWGAQEDLTRLPGDNIPLPASARAAVVEHVQHLRFLSSARLEDGQEEARRLYPNLTAIADLIHKCIGDAHKIARAFEEPLQERLAWFRKQALALDRALASKRLELQDARAAASIHARSVSLLREAMALYGNPHKEPHKSRNLAPEIRKLLVDPDDDGLGPVLVVMRSQHLVNHEDLANLRRAKASLDVDIADLQGKIALLKKKLTELAEVDYTYGPRIAELLQRLLDKKTPLAVLEPVALERDEAGERQSQTLAVFQQGMEARSPEARRKQQGRTGLFYEDQDHQLPATREQPAAASAAVDKKTAAGEEKSAAAGPRRVARARESSAEAPEAPPRTLLRKPVFQRHYESIVTAPAEDDELLSLAPTAPVSAPPPTALPPNVQRIRARAPALPPSASASVAASRAHTASLVPGEKVFHETDRLFDLLVKLPTELRFDTQEDRRHFEELFGISLGGLSDSEAESDTKAEQVWKEGLPDGFLEAVRDTGPYDVVVPRVRPLGSEDGQGDGEEKEGDEREGRAPKTPSLDPAAPADYHKTSFASPLLRRDKK